MAFTLTKNGIKIIKERYGVELDLSFYLKQSKKTSPEDALIGMFGEAYQQIYLKDTLDMKGESHKCAEFFNDLNNFVVFNLRSEAPLNRVKSPERYLGLSPMGQYEVMKGIRTTGPKNDIEAVMMNYEKGNIRIRDMVAFAKNIDRHGGLTEKNMKILASYSEALKRINESRTTGWRWIHPWRNNAEQRDAKVIENIMGGDSLLYSKAVRGAESGLSALEGIEKATLKETLNVEKLEDYVEVAPDPNEPELEDWEIRQNNWNNFLDNLNKQREEEDRQIEEARLKEEEERKKLEQQRLEKEKAQKQQKTDEEPKQEEEDAYAKINAQIKEFVDNEERKIAQRDAERNAPLSVHIDVSDLQENIYENNEQNPKIEEGINPPEVKLDLNKNF